MSSKPKKSQGAAVGQTRRSSNKPSRKDQIISLFLSGMGEIEDIAVITGARASYVGSVLQEAGLHQGYFDLYTSTAHQQNIYSKFFAGKLGFKDVETASESVVLINHLYRQFEFAGDRAGQHHALTMALTMFDRARWTGKGREAGVFLNWLTARLGEAALDLEESSGDEESEGEDEEGAGEPETLP
ncbi:MAG: hypothetical protein QOE46_2351 [Acidobacteriota bacterium]|jgi:hypothetical protein|nr:hypothetical protein [Acidobacteriota bacterium]